MKSKKGEKIEGENRGGKVPSTAPGVSHDASDSIDVSDPASITSHIGDGRKNSMDDRSK